MAQSANLTFFGCFPISIAKIMIIIITCIVLSNYLWSFKV